MVNCLETKRKERALTRAELAEAIQVNVVTIWRWETENMTISHNSLLRLAEFLECDVIDLVPGYATARAHPDTIAEGQIHG